MASGYRIIQFYAVHEAFSTLLFPRKGASPSSSTSLPSHLPYPLPGLVPLTRWNFLAYPGRVGASLGLTKEPFSERTHSPSACPIELDQTFVPPLIKYRASRNGCPYSPERLVTLHRYEKRVDAPAISSSLRKFHFISDRQLDFGTTNHLSSMAAATF